MPKKPPVSEHLCSVNMLKVPKDWLNMHGSIFAMFFYHSEIKFAPKIMFY